MVKTLVQQMAAFIGDLVSYLPPGLMAVVATAFIGDGQYRKPFRHEFVGTLLMIVCTFSAGKWIGKDSVTVAWLSHALGVIAADYIGGGPHVNPAVTVSMFTLGKVSYTEAYVRIAAQLGGGLTAFPLYHAVSEALEWEPFGGPEYNYDHDSDYATAEAAISEFCATLLLCFLIYTVNWEIHFGTYHYIIKQSLTALGIRALIEYFPTAGPAMNPMLATTWFVFGVGTKFQYPTDFEHYFVYWIGPCAAAILASVLYTIYAGGTVFGKTLPLGPVKKAPSASKKKAKNA
jgi:glycerol uptake facilitator-like aquaporin